MIAFTYLIVDSFSIAFLMILYASTRERVAYLPENRCFRTIVLITVAILFADAWAWQLEGQTFGAARYLLWIVNILCYILSAAIALSWFYYVGLKLRINSRVSKLGWAFICLPAGVLVFCSLLTPWTHWLFDIDSANSYQRGPLFVIQMVVPLGYIVAAAVRALFQARLEPLRQQKDECLFLSSFALFPLAGGLLQITYYGLSLAWPCTALSLMLVYVNLQNQRISLDALTGLNNRGQFDKYLYQCMEKNDDGRGFVLFMLDIDNFKKINDIYGHVVGDAALVSASDILCKAFADTSSFIARFGGDEFAIITHFKKIEEIDAALERIDNYTMAFNAAKDRPPYELRFSVGYVQNDVNRFRSYLELINAADARMYLNKQSHKALDAARAKAPENL